MKLHTFITKIFFAALLAVFAVSASAGITVTYFHNDLTGSPVAATNEVGQVVWRKNYTPYGETAGKDRDNRVGYTGHQEEANGLVYAGARYYDPALGRFMSVDPKGFSDKNPKGFNRYAYANNNPYKYVDPDGRDVVSANAALAGFRFMVFVNTGDNNSVPSVGVASDIPGNFNFKDPNIVGSMKSLLETGKLKFGLELSHASTHDDFFKNGSETSQNTGVGEFSDKGDRSTIAVGPGVPGKDTTDRMIDKAEVKFGSKKGDIIPGAKVGGAGEALSHHLPYYGR